MPGFLSALRKLFLPLPSWRLPQPETRHFLPTGNLWMASGRQMGWMYLPKRSGLASSSSAMSKSSRAGL